MENSILVNFVMLQVAAEQAESAPATLDPWTLVIEASPVVQLVMLMLVLMSIGCWFIIGAKIVRLSQATRSSTKFLDLFWGESGAAWNAERLEGVYAQIKSFEGSPVASVFRAGYVELARIAGDSAPAGGDTENIDRALRRARSNEFNRLENYLPFLATTGATAPFIGLFGTVWGIMGSFIAIGNAQDASLATVAPGIAEALIATAIGLVAAIPAVMAYNYFLRKISVLESEVNAFSSDYLNIVRRHFLAA